MTTTSSSWALHDTSSVPLAIDSAPYFAEFVANSWITKASVVLDDVSHVHLGHRDANANTGSLLVVRCKQHRDEVAKKRRFVLPARYGTDEILGTSKAISRLVSSCAISSFVAAEREVI